MTQTLFISKPREEVEDLFIYLQNRGIHLVAESFIAFEPLDVEINLEYDVVFFGSPRAVDFFTAKNSIPKEKQIACVGSITAETLKKKGYSVHFNGDDYPGLEAASRAFANWIGTKRVLFPLSSRSLKTFAKHIPEQQIELRTIYHTRTLTKRIPACSIYVFTSPSNVEGFLNANSVPDNSYVISWGPSTTKALNKSGIVPDHTLQTSSIHSLLQALEKK